MQREKIIARNFANQFVKPLYLEIYRLVMAHQTGEEVIKVAGNFIRVLPSEWEERTDATIELKLGYGEQDREAEKYLAMHQLLTTDPTIGPMYSAQNRFNLLKMVFEKSGVKNVSEFLTPPEMIPPPEPDPMLMKQVELEERKVGVQEKQAEASVAKVQVNAELDSMKIELQRMAHELNVMKTERSEERKDFDSAARYAIATEELELAKATPPDQQNAIISPN
jgi:hypothetical protein